MKSLVAYHRQRLAEADDRRQKLIDAFELKIRKRKRLNIDTAMGFLNRATGIDIRDLHDAYKELARRQVYPPSKLRDVEKYVDALLEELPVVMEPI